MILGTTWRGRWREVFGVDLRTLALFRFTLGAAIALDIAGRLRDLTVFYTDAGVMPRAFVAATGEPLRLSLHLANGEAWFAALLLVLQGLAGLALAFGWRARLAAIVLFVLQGSLLNRNPAILLAGDTLLACLLFWAMFLPLAARWSFDAALAERRPPEDNAHCSVASAGVVLQVLLVYACSALASGHGWQGLVAAGALLALSPIGQRPLRFAALAGAVVLHAAVITDLQPDSVPFAAASALSVLLGGWWWDWAARRIDRGHHLRIYYDGDCASCRTAGVLLREFLALPNTDLQPAQGSVRASALMQAQGSWVVIDHADVAHTRWHALVALLRHSLLFFWLAPLADLKLWEKPGAWACAAARRCRKALGPVTSRPWPERAVSFEAPRWTRAPAGAAIVAILLWNGAALGWLPPGVATALAPLMKPLRIDQRWTLLTPRPRDEGWFVIPGVLDGGRELDLATGKPVDWRKPAEVARAEPGARWRAYRARLADPAADGEREQYARWLCRTAMPGEVASLKLIDMLERPAPGGDGGAEQRVLLRQDCRPRVP